MTNGVSGIQGLGSMQTMMAMRRPDPLTDEQKKQVASILSNYDAENVTADDAKAIFQAFKEAGINPAPGLREAIEDAGFDAENLRSMAMPKDAQRAGGRPMPPPPPDRQGQTQGASSNNGLNLSALKDLQSILSQYEDVTQLSNKEENDLVSQLVQSGLLQEGSLMDLSA